MRTWASLTDSALSRRILAATLAVAACVLASCAREAPPTDADLREVLSGYRQLAHATYADAHARAVELRRAAAVLTTAPGPQTLAQARAAWVAAREPYSFSEALRFGNWFVDEADERINPWPIDEGFLDYVAGDYEASPTNVHARLNLVGAPDDVPMGGRKLRTTPMQRVTLKDAQSLGDAESNVATGYHVIEFLLWGQDRAVDGPGARPWSDYALTATQCTNGARRAPVRHCKRRAAMLLAALDILVQDLELLVAQWGPEQGSFGDRLVQGDPRSGLRRMLFGLAAMSAEELAGERLEVALISGAQEEELDCFSDTTHRSLSRNARGLAGFYLGRYESHRASASLAALARRVDPALGARLDGAFATSVAALQRIEEAGARGETFDRLIASGNPRGKSLLRDAIVALRAQAMLLEELGRRLQLGLLNPRAGSNE